MIINDNEVIVVEETYKKILLQNHQFTFLYIKKTGHIVIKERRHSGLKHLKNNSLRICSITMLEMVARQIKKLILSPSINAA